MADLLGLTADWRSRVSLSGCVAKRSEVSGLRPFLWWAVDLEEFWLSGGRLACGCQSVADAFQFLGQTGSDAEQVIQVRLRFEILRPQDTSSVLEQFDTAVEPPGGYGTGGCLRRESQALATKFS